MQCFSFSRVSWSVSATTELYFLIAKLLEEGPCREATEVSRCFRRRVEIVNGVGPGPASAGRSLHLGTVFLGRSRSVFISTRSLYSAYHIRLVVGIVISRTHWCSFCLVSRHRP